VFNSFPFTGGWAEQPAYVVDIIEAAQSAWQENSKG
jgi:hypothetical protein